MKRETKVIIAFAILGIVLFIVSVGKSPMWNQILVAMFSISQYLITNAGKIITSPVCYGSIGLLLMLAASWYFSNSERQQRREAKQKARRQRLEVLEKAKRERINKPTFFEAVRNKVTRQKKSAYPYGVPTKKREDWARWKRCYAIIKPMNSQGASWNEIKTFIENNHSDLPSSLDTLRNIFNAGNDGLLDEFPPRIKTPS
jgi:type II secretory pathway pseudopilin PulG